MRVRSIELPPIAAADLKVRPIETAETIPGDWYADRRFHDLDCEHVLARSWQLVGHVSQIPEPGRLLCLTIAGEPILLVRDEEGKVRAFFNVCRHRGGPLALDDGQASALRCHYHGWTYGLDGRLRGVPDMAGVEQFTRESFGLVPLDLTEWEGLLFVRLEGSAGTRSRPATFHPPEDDAPGSASGVNAGELSRTNGPEGAFDHLLELSPAEALAGVPARIAPLELSTARFVRRVHYTIACNWKVYVDNYLEGYHLPLVHPELCKLLDYRRYVTELSDLCSLQYSPFLDAGAENLYGAANGRAFYYFLWPNAMLNILPGRLQINRVLPLAHDRTEVHFDYLYEDASTAEARARIEADIDYSDRVQKEDIEICQLVQQRLGSRAYQRGRFSVKRESGVHHFQNLLRAAYGRALAEGRAQAEHRETKEKGRHRGMPA
jgi:choline monooxygenase